MEIALINDETIILLILKLFMKIVTILTIVIKKYLQNKKKLFILTINIKKYNNGNSLNE